MAQNDSGAIAPPRFSQSLYAIKNMIEIEGRKFTFIIASDVVRDGIGVELNEVIKGEEVFQAEIFRNDSKKQVEFNTIETNLPYAAILRLGQLFESEIPREFQE